jgi:hypothetical protein
MRMIVLGGSDVNGGGSLASRRISSNYDLGGLQIMQATACGLCTIAQVPHQTQPYARKIAHRGISVEPELLAEIEYRAKSAPGKVRHPFLKGLREDL